MLRARELESGTRSDHIILTNLDLSRGACRHRNPLRVRAVASAHLCHEANTEQLFSLAGGLSDDNGKMDPYRLSVWVSIAANRKVFVPTKQAILS